MADPARVPTHVAIIMDGNGRWAKQRGLPRLEGHRRGAVVAREVVEWASDAGVRCISLFAFSTENWARPDLEVRGLMRLLATLLPRRVPEMIERGVRLRVLGDVSALPDYARKAVDKALERTAGGMVIDLVLCLSYGGQQELIAGAKKAAEWAATQPDPQAAWANLAPQAFRRFLWSSELPAVDLLIRTGGEQRISNFLLWDAAYTELAFTATYWPEFTRQEFMNLLSNYAGRERRFGLTSQQVANP